MPSVSETAVCKEAIKQELFRDEFCDSRSSDRGIKWLERKENKREKEKKTPPESTSAVGCAGLGFPPWLQEGPLLLGPWPQPSRDGELHLRGAWCLSGKEHSWLRGIFRTWGYFHKGVTPGLKENSTLGKYDTSVLGHLLKLLCVVLLTLRLCTGTDRV